MRHHATVKSKSKRKGIAIATIARQLAEIKTMLGETVTKEDAKSFLTKQDAKNFATKDDLKNFITKEDAKNFLTKEDAKNFATKNDFVKLLHYMQTELVTKDYLEQRLEEYLPTKDWILKLEDRMVTVIRDHEKNMTLWLETIRRHDDALHDCDTRITTIEQHLVRNG